MKALLILIATLALPAQAVTFAHVKNDAKGKIVLTDEVCATDPTMLRSYFYNKDHYTEEGCWLDDDFTVLVIWEKQGTKRYQKKIFTVVERNEWA